MFLNFQDHYYIHLSHDRQIKENSPVRDFVEVNITLPDLDSNKEAFNFEVCVQTSTKDKGISMNKSYDRSILEFDSQYAYSVLNRQSDKTENGCNVYEKHPIIERDINNFIQDMAFQVAEFVETLDFPMATKIKIIGEFNFSFEELLEHRQLKNFADRFEVTRFALKMEYELDSKNSQHRIKI